LLLREVVREHGGASGRAARARREATERELTPWYPATVAVDRARLATQIEVERAGVTPPEPPAENVAGRVRAALAVALGRDPGVFRASSRSRAA
jgi:hypothetical protein